VNKKTGEMTPKGMGAEEIFTIPGAKRRWGSIEGVEVYMERMNAEREIYGGEGLVTVRCLFLRLAAIINSTNRQQSYKDRWGNAFESRIGWPNCEC